MSLSFVTPSDLTAVTWTLAAGTEVGGDYVLAALTDGDPSLPLMIEETTIDLRGDAGSAVRQDVLVLTHHNFQAGTTLRYQMHSDTATWGGATAVDVTVEVPAWVGRWAKHVAINLAALVPVEATRTQRYRRLTNTDANDVPVAIGELLSGRAISSITRGVRLRLSTPEEFGRSLDPSRLGVSTVYDYRSRHRLWSGEVSLQEANSVTDETAFRAWQHDSYGARPFVVWPKNDLEDEPIFGRFADPVYAPAWTFTGFAQAAFVVEELSCGEAY